MALINCRCGYNTYDLEPCNQKDCPRYISVEMEKAKEVLRTDIAAASQKYIDRITEAKKA